MKAAQGKALTPTSFVCDKKRRRYQSLLSVSLTVIAFNSPLILLSVLMSGTEESQMLRLDRSQRPLCFPRPFGPAHAVVLPPS